MTSSKIVPLKNPRTSQKPSLGIKFLRCFKYLSALILVILFLRQVYYGVLKLNEGKMTLISSIAIEKSFIYPSFTVCVTMDTNFTNGFNNKKWLEPYKYDFQFPYPELGVVGDPVLTGLWSLNSLNDPKVLKNLSIEIQDIWTPSIQANFEEPSRCFTYQPKGLRHPGLGKSVSFRLKSRDDPAIAFFFGVHNHGAFVPNLARVFGNDYAIVFARKGPLVGTRYEIKRTNFTELNRDDHPCSNDPLLDLQPGFIMSPEGPKNLDECVEHFYNSNLNCSLPWSKTVSDLEKCTQDEQYIKYKGLIKQLDDASEATFWKLIGCTQRCKFTQFSINPIYESNFDALDYVHNTTDGARVDVAFFFPSPDIELTERVWVYDESNLLADIGGFLGLFLGASLYTLADILASELETIFKRKNV